MTLVLLPGAVAQQQGQGQGQQQQKPPEPGPAGQPPGVQPAQPAVNPEEEDAYKAFFNLGNADPAAVISSGEEFLSKFPGSRYREMVYSRLTQAYMSTDQLDKFIVAGEKALEINPNNVDVLSALSYGMLRRFNANDLDAEQKLIKVENYSKKGIELLTTLPKPELITEEDFARAKNQKLAMCHSGLGFSYFFRQRYADAVTEFQQATEIVADPDPVDFYLLGASYQNSRRLEEAANAFGRCSEIDGPMQDRCKQAADRVKKLAAQEAPKP